MAGYEPAYEEIGIEKRKFHSTIDGQCDSATYPRRKFHKCFDCVRSKKPDCEHCRTLLDILRDVQFYANRLVCVRCERVMQRSQIDTHWKRLHGEEDNHRQFCPKFNKGWACDRRNCE
eukprot:43265_1